MNYKTDSGILYDILTEFYFADWTRKCDYDKMTSEEVVEAAIAVCKKLKRNIITFLMMSLEFVAAFEDKDWAEDFT